MEMRVVGAGVGRTGTHSLKIALEQLLGAPCHHMVEVFAHPEQVPVWTDAIEGRPVDWHALLADYGAIVDWPGGSFWPELTAAYPDALVLLSVRDPESWYRSATNTILHGFTHELEVPNEWMESLRKLFHDRFSDDFENPTAMMDAFERHNDAVRAAIPASRLLEWTPGDGWDPICERLGLPVPDAPFPVTNTTSEFREMVGLPTLDAVGERVGRRVVSEVSDRYRRLAARFADLIAAVPPDRWSSPSPCEGWTALDLVQHVVDTQSLFLGLVGREPTGAPPAADGPLAAWQAASAVIQADLDDPERATATFEGFFGQTTFEAAIDRFVNFDLVVHGWDLARATGGDERIDPADVARVHAGTEGFADTLRSPGVCGPEVPVDDDADEQTRLLAILGRRA